MNDIVNALFYTENGNTFRSTEVWKAIENIQYFSMKKKLSLDKVTFYMDHLLSSRPEEINFGWNLYTRDEVIKTLLKEERIETAQANYEEWSQRHVSINILAFHSEILNIVDLFQRKVSGILLALPDLRSKEGEATSNISKSVWLWDYALSVQKCKEQDLLSLEAADFLLEHLLSEKEKCCIWE